MIIVRKIERNRKVTGLVLAAGLLAAALTGCGSVSTDKAAVATAEMAYEDSAYNLSSDAGIYEEYSEADEYEEAAA